MTQPPRRGGRGSRRRRRWWCWEVMASLELVTHRGVKLHYLVRMGERTATVQVADGQITRGEPVDVR